MDPGCPLVATLSNYTCYHPDTDNTQLIKYFSYLSTGRTHFPTKEDYSLQQKWLLRMYVSGVVCLCGCVTQMCRCIHVYKRMHVHLCMCLRACILVPVTGLMCASHACIYVLECICEHWCQNVHLYVCMCMYLLVWLLVSECMCVNVTFGALAFFSVTHWNS